jgi:hypothetical protein
MKENCLNIIWQNCQAQCPLVGMTMHVSLFIAEKLLVGCDKVPAMTFYNFCHVTVISGDENITLQGYHII